MIDVYTLTLEDNKEYIIIDTIENGNNKYFVLTNDNADVTVRKVVNENGEECLTKLDDEDELAIVMTLFNEKNKGEAHEE